MKIFYQKEDEESKNDSLGNNFSITPLLEPNQNGQEYQKRLWKRFQEETSEINGKL